MAEAFNDGVSDQKGARYPFQHATWPGQPYYDASSSHCPDSKIRLDRPPFRDCYNNLNIDGISDKDMKADREGLECKSVRREYLPHYRSSK